MISLEMASKAPQRLQSLMLINTHAGGFGAFPPIQGNISELFKYASLWCFRICLQVLESKQSDVYLFLLSIV